jgi:hypothetical protein
MTDTTTPEDTGSPAHAARKTPPSGRAADEQAWKDYHDSHAEPLADQEPDEAQADVEAAPEVQP